jgi:hypothetical protein
MPQPNRPLTAPKGARVKPRNHHAAALRSPALRPKVIDSKKLYTRKGRRP